MKRGIRTVFGVAAGVGVGVVVVIAAALLRAGFTRFGVDALILASVGILASWQGLDIRFKTGPTAVTATLFIACVAFFVDLTIIEPIVSYDPARHFATLRVMFFDLPYDWDAIHVIDDAVWYFGVPSMIVFGGLFIWGFLSSGLAIAPKAPQARRRWRTALIVGMYAIAALAIVTNLSYRYEWGFLPYPVDRLIRFLFPCVLLCLDAVVQKIEFETNGTGIPIDLKRHVPGLGAILLCFFGVGVFGLSGYARFLVILLPAIALATAIAAATMHVSAKRNRFGRVVAMEATAAALITIGTILSVLIQSIGIQ